MPGLLIEEGRKTAATVSQQTHPFRARDRHRANIGPLSIDRCMKPATSLTDRKRGRLEIGDSNLSPILAPRREDHFRAPGNPHGKAVRWSVEKPLAGETPASLQQLRFNLRLLHDGSPALNEFQHILETAERVVDD